MDCDTGGACGCPRRQLPTTAFQELENDEPPVALCTCGARKATSRERFRGQGYRREAMRRQAKMCFMP